MSEISIKQAMDILERYKEEILQARDISDLIKSMEVKILSMRRCDNCGRMFEEDRKMCKGKVALENCIMGGYKNWKSLDL